MDNMDMHIYDDDEYMYQKQGESDADYGARMARLREQRNARMSEEEKQSVLELAERLDSLVIADA